MSSKKVNRTEFLQVLSLVEPGLSTRNFIEQSSCYVFVDGWVVTFNDEVSVRAKTGLPEEFSGAFHAKEMKAALESMTDDEVELKLLERELRINARRKRVGIRREAEILLPIDQVPLPERWVLLPDDFRQAVETVVPAAGTNTEEFLACVVHVTSEYMEACDRMQAARHDCPVEIDRDFLVRATSLAPAAKMGIVKLGETDEWLHLRNKTLIYSCRRHLMEYPDEQINTCFDSPGESCRLPQGGVEATKLGGVFADDKVRVRLTQGHMVVRGEGAYGWSEVDLECAYTGRELSFRINPALLTTIVSQHNECEVSPGRLRVIGEKWKYFSILGRDAEAEVATQKTEPQLAGT